MTIEELKRQWSKANEKCHEAAKELSKLRRIPPMEAREIDQAKAALDSALQERTAADAAFKAALELLK